jgi:hypothetical protein
LQHPLIRHFAAILFLLLSVVSFFGNGCVIYIFLKVRTTPSPQNPFSQN